MAKLSWFKHYNTATRGITLQQFIAEKDYECVALFWFLLEYLSATEGDIRDGSCSIKYSVLCREMNMKPSKIRRVLARFSAVSQSWNCRDTGEKLEFLVPNWLELQETRGGKRSSKSLQKTGEVRSKKLDKEVDVVKQPTTNEQKINSSSLFELRMKFQAWESFLKQNNIYETRLGHGLDKISERFESVDKLESFVTEVLSSSKAKSMNAIELRKYIKGAIANEAGLVKNT